jgi:hypothetical protein
MDEDAKNKAGREPEADQVTDRSLGEIEGARRFIPVHAGRWQTWCAAASNRNLSTRRDSWKGFPTGNHPCSLLRVLFQFLLDRESGGKSLGRR